jgi:hypothetical protein
MWAKLFGLAVVAVVGCYAGDVCAADAYSLTDVRRVDSNTYSFRSGSVAGVILTRYCFEYPYGESAILLYERGGSDNKIIFRSGGACDVAKVFTA